MKYLSRLQWLGLVLLRIALGIIFFTHGYPKLAHLRGNAQMQSFFMEHGLPWWFLYVAGVIELFGGALVLLGLFMRPAALILALEMCVAIAKVHSGHGIFGVHDYEFPLTLATSCFLLATTGPGPISLDSVIFGGEKGGT